MLHHCIKFQPTLLINLHLSAVTLKDHLLLFAPCQSTVTAQDHLGQEKACLHLLLKHTQEGQCLRPALCRRGGFPVCYVCFTTLMHVILTWATVAQQQPKRPV